MRRTAAARAVAGAVSAALCASAATAGAAAREACPQLRDGSGDADAVDPRQRRSADLLAVTLAAGAGATQVRVRVADLPDAPEATPLGHQFEVFLRGRTDVFKIRMTVANGGIRGSLWRRPADQPVADPEAPLNRQSGTFDRVALLKAVYDGKADLVRAEVPWALSGELGTGQLLSGLSATAYVTATNEGAAGSEQTDSAGLTGSADLADGGRPYVVGARGCPAG